VVATITADGFERLADDATGEYARTVIEGRMADPDGPLAPLRPAGTGNVLPPG
jgi:proteasome beta subunit